MRFIINSQSFSKKSKIHVVGAGLAGSECALQLAEFGYSVVLYEMRPNIMTPAHKTEKFAELVCSNSFGSLNPISAPGQLKWEAEQLQSFVLKAAKDSHVPAGQALGVDREVFSKIVSDMICNHPKIEIQNTVVEKLSDIPRPAIIATGPLTSESLAQDLQKHFGNEFLYFFDAIAPIIDADSINTDICWKADRYDKGTPDYYNCPMNKQQYFDFINAVKEARKIEPKHFETTDFFEGCMPIETMVERGDRTLRFGPMKPVGLINPKTGKDEYAIVQLRQDNKEGTAYNMVGFQTRMTYAEQIRVFRMIPGLESAEFLKLGSIHRNLFINTPTLLNSDLSSKNDPWLFFAGQITGVEGYFESTCIGLLVAKFLDSKMNGKDFIPPPRETAMGSLLNAITDPSRSKHFQPTNINFGLLPPIENPPKDKNQKKEMQIIKAKEALLKWTCAISSYTKSLPNLILCLFIFYFLPLDSAFATIETEVQVSVCEPHHRLASLADINSWKFRRNFEAYFLDTPNFTLYNQGWVIRVRINKAKNEVIVAVKNNRENPDSNKFSNIECEYDLHGNQKKYACKLNNKISYNEFKRFLLNKKLNKLFSEKQFEWLKYSNIEIPNGAALAGPFPEWSYEKQISDYTFVLDLSLASNLTDTFEFSEISARAQEKNEIEAQSKILEYISNSKIAICENQLLPITREKLRIFFNK